LSQYPCCQPIHQRNNETGIPVHDLGKISLLCQSRQCMPDMWLFLLYSYGLLSTRSRFCLEEKTVQIDCFGRISDITFLNGGLMGEDTDINSIDRNVRNMLSRCREFEEYNSVHIQHLRLMQRNSNFYVIIWYLMCRLGGVSLILPHPHTLTCIIN
jgi:hypothetical protein